MGEQAMTFFKRLAADERGAAGVEFGLILALMVIGMIGSLSNLGDSVKSSYEDTGQKIAQSH